MAIGQTIGEMQLFLTFMTAVFRHLGFLIFHNCNGPQSKNGQCALLCQCSWRLGKPLLSYGDFSDLKISSVRHL